MRTHDFDYELPEELIAQEPLARRDESRLMVVRRDGSPPQHRLFKEIVDYLRPGDLMVFNDSRVIPARLRGRNAKTGGEFEILLLEENGVNDWWAMMRPGKRAGMGTELAVKRTGDGSSLGGGLVTARVIGVNEEGHRRLAFSGRRDITECLEAVGEMPLPPYIKRGAPNLRADDRERYQTVYARVPGSVAAPTAGLHFTPQLIDRLHGRGVEVCHLTLHVGLGTFAPVKTDSLESHVMHEERFELSAGAANAINAALRDQRRVVAVGTTTVRVLESLARANDGRVVEGQGRTRLFIRPPSEFRVVGALVTNYHLPCSTLLMLVSAFMSPGRAEGREMLLGNYREAVRMKYRFFSYGDAMFIE